MINKSGQPGKVANLEEFGQVITRIFAKSGVKVVGFKLPKQEYIDLKGDNDAKG